MSDEQQATPGSRPPRREYGRKRGSIKDWRKGGARWRFDGEVDDDTDHGGSGKTEPPRFRLSDPGAERDALVIQTGGPAVALLDGEEEIRAVPRRSTTTENRNSSLVTIGDRVRYMQVGDGDAAITHVYARTTEIARASIGTRGFSQVIAANIDAIVVVTAATRELLRPGLVDRYLIAAGMGGMGGIVCINKMDLVDDEDAAVVEEIAAMYRDADYATVLTSCESGEGVDALAHLLTDRISAVVGHSGVGKTSLVNRLLPGLDARTQDVSEQSRRGAHTTTQSTLHELPGGGWIADTPGIREFALTDPDLSDLHTYYPEFVRVAGECRFPHCTHTHEPDCAVQRAVEDERIHPIRYRNYLQIRHS